MDIEAIILTVMLVEIVVAILIGWWLARRAPPLPPSFPLPPVGSHDTDPFTAQD